jgi:capsular exopolysaccharide synthesis family protein
MSSTPVFERAADLVGGIGAQQLQDSVEVIADEDLNRLLVRATAGTADDAATRANAMPQAFEDVARDQRLEEVAAGTSVIEEEIADLRDTVQGLSRQLETSPSNALALTRLQVTEEQLLALQGRVSEVSADAAMFGSGVQSQEPAQPPQAPASPNPVRDGALTAILAFVIGAAVAYLRVGRPARVEQGTDPGAILEVPLLGEVPEYSHSELDLAELLPGTAASQAYRFVLSSIELSLGGLGGSSVMVTSAETGDGRTSTALHVAVAAARGGQRVLLVDADVGRATLTRLLRVQEHAGLVECVGGSADIDQVTRRFRLSDDAHLSVVPAGQGSLDAVGLTHTPQFKHVMQHIRSRADVVIVDSPPLLSVAHATEIAAEVDAIVLVVDVQTDSITLDRVRRRLALVPAPLIGYVVNRAVIDHGGDARSDGRWADARRRPSVSAR